MAELEGEIVRRGNFREDADSYRGAAGKPAWVRRALRVDGLLQKARAEALPLRVIMNEGVRRDRSSPEASPSKVTLRELDPEPWHIAEYDQRTGAHVLMRGMRRAPFVDQFDLCETGDDLAATRNRNGREFIRDPTVRSAALLRAAGRCEYCNAVGFRMVGGAIYLESHHIIPLSEDGKDILVNVIVLCPNHHREAHHGVDRQKLRECFQTMRCVV